MSMCTHDETCPGTGPRHELGIPAGILPGVTHAPMSNARVKRLRRAILKASADARRARTKAAAR